MLFITLLSVVFAVINVIFGILPNIPSVPEEFSNIIKNFFDLIFQNSGLVGFFLPMDVVKIALPVALVIVNFKHIYNLIKWLIAKLPISSQ